MSAPVRYSVSDILGDLASPTPPPEAARSHNDDDDDDTTPRQQGNKAAAGSFVAANESDIFAERDDAAGAQPPAATTDTSGSSPQLPSPIMADQHHAQQRGPPSSLDSFLDRAVPHGAPPQQPSNVDNDSLFGDLPRARTESFVLGGPQPPTHQQQQQQSTRSVASIPSVSDVTVSPTSSTVAPSASEFQPPSVDALQRIQRLERLLDAERTRALELERRLAFSETTADEAAAKCNADAEAAAKAEAEVAALRTQLAQAEDAARRAADADIAASPMPRRGSQAAAEPVEFTSPQVVARHLSMSPGRMMVKATVGTTGAPVLFSERRKWAAGRAASQQSSAAAQSPAPRLSPTPSRTGLFFSPGSAEDGADGTASAFAERRLQRLVAVETARRHALQQHWGDERQALASVFLHGAASAASPPKGNHHHDPVPTRSGHTRSLSGTGNAFSSPVGAMPRSTSNLSTGTMFSADFSADDARRFEEAIQARFVALEEGVEQRVRLLSEALQTNTMASPIVVTSPNPTAPAATDGGDPAKSTPSSAALPPLAVSQVQHMLTGGGGGERGHGHRRTNSGASNASFASQNASFAADDLAAMGLVSPSSKTAAGGGADSGRGASSSRPRGASLANSPAQSSPASQHVAGFASGVFNQSRKPPLKGTERPLVHRKLILTGRNTVQPGQGAPVVRIDQITAEARTWRTQDLRDYNKFTALQVFVLGAPGSGKTSLVHCLTNKPPSFFKSRPKVDTPTLGIKSSVHTLNNVRMPDVGVPLGGFDDQNIDIRSLMKQVSSANAGVHGGGTTPATPAAGRQGGKEQPLQVSATVKITDLPEYILASSTAGSLPARGAMYVICFDMAAKVTEARAHIAAAVRHVLAVCTASGFPLPSFIIDDDDDAAASAATPASPTRSAADVDAMGGADASDSSPRLGVQLQPLRVSFILVGTHTDKLPKGHNDEVSIQSTLREHREWLLRLFNRLVPSSQKFRTGGGVSTMRFALGAEGDNGHPLVPVVPHLADCYAVSCDKWSVVGERPRSAATFPDLMVELYSYCLLHSPTGATHIASTVLRHFAASLVTEADADPLGGPVVTVKREVARAAVVPLKKSNGAQPQPPPESGISGTVVNNGAAPLTVEQEFESVHKIFTQHRTALAKEQREATLANQHRERSGSKPPADVAASSTSQSVLSPQASMGDGGASRLLAANSAATFDIGTDFTKAPDAYHTATMYAVTALSFGVTTLFTALDRWCDFAGCVLDGVIFLGFVTQHLHLRSVVGRLIQAASAHLLPTDGDDDPELRAALEQETAALTAELTRKMCASLLAVARARGYCYLTDTVPDAGCSAVFLGTSMQNDLLSLVTLPTRIGDLTHAATFQQMADHKEAVQQLWARAQKEGVVGHQHDDFVKQLLRSVAEVVASDEDARHNGGVSRRPPSAAASNLNFVFELMQCGVMNVKLFEHVNRPPFEVLTEGEVLHMFLGPRVMRLTGDVPDAWTNAHRVYLPRGTRAMCSANRDFVVPAVAQHVPQSTAEFLAYALCVSAESSDHLLTGTVSVACAPLSLPTTIAVALVEIYSAHVHKLHVWRDAFYASLTSVGSTTPDTSGRLPPGAVEAHVLALFGGDDASTGAATCKIIVSIVSSTPTAAAASGASGLGSKSDAFSYVLEARQNTATPGEAMATDDSDASGATPVAFRAVSDVFDMVVRVFEHATHLFGRPSAPGVCPGADEEDEDLLADPAEGGLSSVTQSSVCTVAASARLGGMPLDPWDVTAAHARERLSGVPKHTADVAINALRRLCERSTTDLSLEPVLVAVLSTHV